MSQPLVASINIDESIEELLIAISSLEILDIQGSRCSFNGVLKVCKDCIIFKKGESKLGFRISCAINASITSSYLNLSLFSLF